MLVDPDDRTIMVFRAGQPMAVVRGPHAIDLSDIVPSLRFTADEVFGALRLD